jgi:osmotically inducible protein OsmC
MPARKAEATWSGSLQEGSGSVKLGSGAYEGPYSYASRFESGAGTNPEELIGAAIAGCFTMQLSSSLAREGFTVNRVHTTASVHLEKGESGFSISRIDLQNEGDVTGLDEATYRARAEDAKKNCIISRALASVPEITLDVKLV